jgi:hypothetical protein
MFALTGLAERFKAGSRSIGPLVGHAPTGDRRGLLGLLRQPGGFEGRTAIHIAPDANHPSSAHRNDNCRVGFQLDPAASTAPVFVQEHNDVIAGVDELLCL